VVGASHAVISTGVAVAVAAAPVVVVGAIGAAVVGGLCWLFDNL
jgi:hypothetical protein